MSFFRNLFRSVSRIARPIIRTAAGVGAEVLIGELINPRQNVAGALQAAGTAVLGSVKEEAAAEGIRELGVVTNRINQATGLQVQPQQLVNLATEISSSRPATNVVAPSQFMNPPNMVDGAGQSSRPNFGANMTTVASEPNQRGAWDETGFGYQSGVRARESSIAYTSPEDEMAPGQVMPPGGNSVGRGVSGESLNFIRPI